MASGDVGGSMYGTPWPHGPGNTLRRSHPRQSRGPANPVNKVSAYILASFSSQHLESHHTAKVNPLNRIKLSGECSSTHFHRRVIHMIVFSRPPGRRRRAGLPSVRLREAGDVWTSSSGGDALRWPRKATLRAALRDLRTSSRGPCDGPHHGEPRS